MKSNSRREFLKIGGMTLLGVVAPGPFLRILQALPPPWDQPPAPVAGADGRLKLSSPMTLGSGKRNEYPVVASRNGKVWTAWVNTTAEGEEELFLSELSGDRQITVEGKVPRARGRYHRPTLAVTADGIWVAWSEVLTEDTEDPKNPPSVRTRIRLAKVRASGEIEILRALPAFDWAGFPALALNSEGQGYLVFEGTTSSGRIGIWGSRIEDGKFVFLENLVNPLHGDARRPAVALLEGGDAWLVWDESEEEETVGIKAQRLQGKGTAGKRLGVTRGAGFHFAPAAAYDGKGLTWLAWFTNCWPDGTIDVPRRIEVAALTSRGEVKFPPQPEGVARETDSTVQGVEFPQLACTPNGYVWLTGRASQNFYVMFFDGKRWTSLARLLRDGWGGRGQRVAAAATGPARLMTVRRDLDDALAQQIEADAAAPRSAPQLSGRFRPAVANARLREHIEFEPWGEMRFYFGDIHGHTSLSDGTGDVDEFYLMRRDVYAMDFAALTDHDSFVGNTLSPSEWEEIKGVSDHFNEPGRFVTLFGQEWTSLRVQRGGGHFNVYSLRRDVPLFDHTKPDYDTAQKLVAAARRHGALVIPHHIAWTGTVWEAFDPEVTPLVEIVSVHGAHEFMGNRPIPHRGGMRGYFAQDGLARGLRFGFIGGTDCHGLLWQHGECWKRDPYTAGLACVLAPELTREAVFDALRRRRCYATSGVRMRIVFEANGQPMGSEISSDGPVKIRVDVNSEVPLRWLEIVKDNQTVFSYGGEGHRTAFTWEDAATGEPRATHWYYLRVTTRDDNMAWTSPVWVTPKAT